MTLSFQGFINKPLFGSKSSNSSGSTTPRANQSGHLPNSTSSSQTIRPPKRDSFEQVSVEVETYGPASPPTLPPTWTSSINDALEGLSLAVEHYLSSPEEDSDEESPSIAAALKTKKTKEYTQKTGKISRTDPNYRNSEEYREIRKKIGRIHKFQTIPPEARLVPHHLWYTPEDKLPPRFNKTGKNTGKDFTGDED